MDISIYDKIYLRTFFPPWHEKNKTKSNRSRSLKEKEGRKDENNGGRKVKQTEENNGGRKEGRKKKNGGKKEGRKEKTKRQMVIRSGGGYIRENIKW
jgi:hypothetical protein